MVRALLEAHGGAAIDYFKLTDDKSYVFSPDGRAAVAYAVAMGTAVALGDPIGRSSSIPPALDAFLVLCRDNAWQPVFHQVGPSLLPLYRERGLQVLKIGEEASVDLRRFSEHWSEAKSRRQLHRRFLREGFRVDRSDPPLGAPMLAELEGVSADWLAIPGRRERRFTLGRFERAYVEHTPVYVVRDAEARAVAFANLIPSYRPGEATIDLMRHRASAPNGTMDFLFIELMLDLGVRGFEWFGLGLAPFAGVGTAPDASFSEQAVRELTEHLNRFFSYKGLRAYKAKFDPEWEDRFIVYTGGPLGLVRTTLGLTRLTDG